jgi:uncharacterized metal-binding protein YceD (DUF177 family)
MTDTPLPRFQPLRVAALPTRKPTPFDLRPDAGWLAQIALDMGAIAVRKLVFRGEIKADGRRDWQLSGQLGATVVQPCVVSAAPVTTRIDIPVLRRFLAEMPPATAPESEIPEDDTLEPLGPEIDPAAVMIEALSLALPDYPRAEGASLDTGAQPGSDPSPRPNPFAVLKALKPGSDG